MKKNSEILFVLIILFTVFLAVILKFILAFSIIYFGKDIQKDAAWVRYVYDVKEKLARDTGPSVNHQRIIIVAGSNGLFGINNTIISEITGIPVINMSTHAALFLDYHIKKVLPYVHSGDVIVMPLEFSYYSGKGDESFMIENMAFWDKKYFQEMPFSLQIKWAGMLPIRFYYYSLLSFKKEKLKLLEREEVLSQWKDAVQKGNIRQEYGFLALHADGTFQSPSENTFKGDVWYVNYPSDEVLKEVEYYKKMLEEKGAKVIFTYPAMMNNPLFQIDQPHVISYMQQVYDKLAEYNIILSCQMKDFYYDRSLFADTFYHLTTEGARVRSQRLGECLRGILNKNTINEL